MPIPDEVFTELRSIQAWIAQNRNLSEFHSKKDYMDFCFEIVNRTRCLIVMTISLVPEEYAIGMPRDKAVINGLLARQYKMYDSLCMNVSSNRGEIAQIFVRLFFEAYIYMKYLIKHGGESINSFVISSYKASYKIHEDLSEKARQRELSAIEKRIKKKIENQISSDGLTLEDLSSVKNWKVDRKSFGQILKDVDLEMGIHYPYIYGRPSAAVHGTWLDIRLHHLVREGNLYHPKPDFSSVDPRDINPMTIACLGAVQEYLEWAEMDPNKGVIDLCQGLQDLVRKLEDLHEEKVAENWGKYSAI